MGSKRRKARPMWMWHFRNAEYCLGKILTTLKTLEPNAMATPELRKWTGIDFNELDIESGATSNGSSFFTPRHDGTCKISNTGRDPDSVGEDDFTCCRRLREAGINRNSGLQMDVAFAFRDYARDLADVYQFHDEWEYIPEKSQLKGQFSSSRNSPHGFDVFRGSQIASTRQCHRSVWMTSHNPTDANWPSVSELIVLVSWMVGAMKSQKAMLSSWKGKSHLPFHHTFPTLVVSSEPRARARVLYGYFDGKLRVQFSKAQELDTPSYIEVMNTLLQWAWPRARKSTRMIRPPLPTIFESDEEEEIDLGVVTKLWGIGYLMQKTFSFVRKGRSFFRARWMESKERYGYQPA